MKKLALFTSFVTLLTLSFAFGFAGSASAAPASDTLDAFTPAELLADRGPADALARRHPVKRALARAGKSMIHAVRSNCDCGDVECATQALADQKAKILAKLPEACDADCQARFETALDKLTERILNRVENASCEPGGGRPSRP